MLLELAEFSALTGVSTITIKRDIEDGYLNSICVDNGRKIETYIICNTFEHTVEEYLLGLALRHPHAHTKGLDRVLATRIVFRHRGHEVKRTPYRRGIIR